MLHLTPGTLLDRRYELVKVLGSGAVGTVVHVLDRELDGLSFALKLLHSHLANDPITIKRFCAESLLARQLSHQNIVRVYDVVSSGSLHYLTMEYIQGCGLDELLAGSSGRRLPFSEASFILRQILNALTVAHEQGIVHRDLKPSNVLIDRAGIVRLADFGLAMSINSANGLTKTGELIGTPTYMSPEQFTGRSDPLSDLYSFAILAFELLVGAPPFVAESAVGLMQQHLSAPFPADRLRASSVPEWFVTLCERCAAKAINDRPASARAALAAFAQELPEATEPFVQRSLVAAVRQRQRSHHLLSPSFRKTVLGFWMGSVMIATFGVIHEENSRVRLAARALEIQRATGISASPVLTAFGFGNIHSLTSADLFSAIERETIYDVEVLLRTGVSPAGVDATGQSTLHAALDAPVPILDLLCRYGAPLELRDRNGDTPLLAAVRRGLSGHARILLTWNASLSSPGLQRENALTLAVAQGDLGMVKELAGAHSAELLRLQRYITKAGLNTMHIAAQKWDAAMLETLIANAFDVNMRDGEGLTPLMRLLREQRTKESERAVQVLLASFADLRARDNAGRTAADHIRQSGNLDWLEILGQTQ